MGPWRSLAAVLVVGLSVQRWLPWGIVGVVVVITLAALALG